MTSSSNTTNDGNNTVVSMDCKYCCITNIQSWKREEVLDNMCNKCQKRYPIKNDDPNTVSTGTKKSNGVNKSKWSGKDKYKLSGSLSKYTRNRNVPKGKGRRTYFKNKTSSSVSKLKSTDRSSHSTFFQGQCFKAGDIVSVVDHVDRKTYYAQCTGFLTNQFGEQLVSYTWLLPTEPVDENKPFDPSLFYLGPDDGSLHHIDSVTFVCHAPSDYFKPLSFYKVSSKPVL